MCGFDANRTFHAVVGGDAVGNVVSSVDTCADGRVSTTRRLARRGVVHMTRRSARAWPTRPPRSLLAAPSIGRRADAKVGRYATRETRMEGLPVAPRTVEGSGFPFVRGPALQSWGVCPTYKFGIYETNLGSQESFERRYRTGGRPLRT